MRLLSQDGTRRPRVNQRNSRLATALAGLPPEAGGVRLSATGYTRISETGNDRIWKVP